MSNTIRAYNKKPIIGGPGFQGWISSQKLKAEDLKDPNHPDFIWLTWIGYHPYAACGRMRGWKDWRLRSRRRQAWKMDVRQQSKEVIGKIWLGDRYLTWIDEDLVERC